MTRSLPEEFSGAKVMLVSVLLEAGGSLFVPLDWMPIEHTQTHVQDTDDRGQKDQLTQLGLL